MHRLCFFIIVPALVAASGCVYDVTIGEPDPGLEPQFPQRDQWRVAIESELAEDVGQITIGGKEVEGNFANRGDVEVRFDGEPGRVVVEMRRFGFASDLEAAQDEFGRLSSWAFSGEVLRHPEPEMAESDCAVTWHDGCELRVYYDGQIQPERSGADLRVTLPATYRGALRIVTEDLTVENGYPLRGDVSVFGLPGRAEIEVQRGTVDVSLARDILTAPACGKAANDACETWSEDGKPAPWDLSCGCVDFGRVEVDAWSADVVVDVPPQLWTQLSLENAYLDGTELECALEIECAAFDACESTFEDAATPGRRRAELNDPGDSALEGAGYVIDVFSDACVRADYVDGPEDFEAPDVDRRGDIRICSGCLEG